MNPGYQSIGDAIYAVMTALDIEAIYEDGWAEQFNTPPKSYADYPSFAVIPASDIQATLDSRSDSDTYEFSVYLFDTFKDSQVAEDRMRELADLVRERFRAERDANQPLSITNLYDLTLTGEWGGDPDYGHRFYRLGLSVKVRQELTP